MWPLLSCLHVRFAVNQTSNTQASNTPDINHEDNLNESTDNAECLKQFVHNNPDLFEVNKTEDEEFDAWEAFDIDNDEEFGCYIKK